MISPPPPPSPLSLATLRAWRAQLPEPWPQIFRLLKVKIDSDAGLAKIPVL